MDKKHLLTIGNISKQTGVHIKSLRYYDKIGILPPAHVDTETGYRYYDFSQIQLVEAIQLCVELDIPLNRFTELLTEDKKSIRYGKLIAYGSMLADEKIRAINTKLIKPVPVYQRREGVTGRPADNTGGLRFGGWSHDIRTPRLLKKSSNGNNGSPRIVK